MNHGQYLAARGPHGHDEPSAGRKLVDQRGRDLCSTGGHDDPVERLPPCAEAPIANTPLDTLHPQPLKRCTCPLRQFRHPFERDDLPDQLRQHRRLISRTGANLEHPVLRPGPERAGHHRHHVGL